MCFRYIYLTKVWLTILGGATAAILCCLLTAMDIPAADRDSWKKIQQRAFTNWFNDRLRGNLKVASEKVNDLETDLKDGILLIKLLEQLAKPRKVGRYNKMASNKLICIGNLGLCFNFIKKENIKLVNIGPEDIYDSNLKLILGLIWTLIGRYQIRSSGRGLSTKQAMKEWLNTVIPEYNIENFNQDWNDGRALCGLVDCLKPGLCPNHMSKNPREGLENCKLGMELANSEFGIPMILDPSDLNNPDVDDLSVMTYLSYFFAPFLEQLLKWIQRKIPKQNITNFNTDWNTGVNLAALMEACNKGVMSDWKSMDPHKSLANMEECIDKAKRRLGINCPVAPEILTDPKVDEIVMATYLSRFKYAKAVTGADKMSVLSVNTPHGAAPVDIALEIELDLGDDPTTAINDLEVLASGPLGSTQAELSTGDKTTAVFVPTETGQYTVSCQCNNEDIQGSPFTVQVIDPKDWSLATDPPKFLYVGKLHRLPIKGDNSGIKVGCAIKDLAGSPAPFLTSTVDTGNGGSVILDPKDIGQAEVSVTIIGYDIQKSPFKVRVCDPTKCSISGLGAGNAKVGEPVTFDIATAGSGDDNPKVIIKGPSSEVKPKLKNNGDGNINSTFTPQQPGEHDIIVVIGDEPIPGCPFKKFAEGLPDSGSCSANGPGLTEAIATIPAEFSILTPEKDLLEMPDSLIVEVTSDDGNDSGEVELKDSGNGTYQATYTVPKEGNYKINIYFYGSLIPGSPFQPEILPPPDASKCRAYGPALHPNALLIAGRALDIFVDAKKAGTGQLEVDAQGPKNSSVKTYVAENDLVYSLKLDTPLAGWYVISVFWAQWHIPGSPFKLRVRPAANAGNVRAYGPGLGQAIEVGKTSTFTIETKDAGIGTLSVKVHGIKDAFKVEVNPVSEDQPRTLIGEYNPTQGGDYSVVIKWSGEEIPGSPFAVRVVDLEQEKQRAAEAERIQVEKEEYERRKRLTEDLRKQRESWMEAQLKAQQEYTQSIPKFLSASTSGKLLAAPTGGHVTSRHSKKKQVKKVKSGSVVIAESSTRKRNTSVPQLQRRVAPRKMKKSASAVEVAMQNKAEAMIDDELGEFYGITPTGSFSVRPSKPVPIAPRTVPNERETLIGEELDDRPVPYTPVYLATGDAATDGFGFNVKATKPKKKAKKKNKQWRF